MSFSGIKPGRSIPTTHNRSGSMDSERILRSKTKGRAMTLLNLNKKKIKYKYFDNFKELVDRLRLLVASQVAGNSGQNNEIISIIEELREAKIIK